MQHQNVLGARQLHSLAIEKVALPPKQMHYKKRAIKARSASSSASSSSSSIISEVATRITYAKNQRPPTPYPTHDPIDSSSDSEPELTIPDCQLKGYTNQNECDRIADSQETEIPPTGDTTPMPNIHIPQTSASVITTLLQNQVQSHVQALEDTRNQIMHMTQRLNALRDQESKLVQDIVLIKNTIQSIDQ